MRGLRITEALQKENPTVKLNKIPDKLETIAEVLKQDGYRTYGVTDNVNICKEMGFAQGFDYFKNDTYKGADAVNDQLKEMADQIKRSGKYFLYVHYMDPHKPYHMRLPWFKSNTDPHEEEISAYDSEINYVDDKIREVFDLFGWKENTVFILTSDHGEEFNDHGGVGHGKTLFNEVIRVPLMIYFPQRGVMEPRRVGANVSVLDIFPTIKELLALPIGEESEGVSLLPLVKETASKGEGRYFFSFLSKERRKGNDLIIKSVLSNNLKYIYTHPDKDALFDLERDPGERFNLFDTSRNTGNQMKKRLFSFEESCASYAEETTQILLGKEKLKHLRALGYIAE
jgi:arylsulfatase A-like enzyme